MAATPRRGPTSRIRCSMAWAKAYQDRSDAGRALADALQEAGVPSHPPQATDQTDGRPLVLALPRGGVPVGSIIAERLNADLDVLIVRKLGVPGQPELAMGAIAGGGGSFLHDEVIQQAGVEREEIEQIMQRERAELQRRAAAYRGDRPEPAVRGRAVILVDDGLATGSSMMAAARAVRTGEPRELIVAVPVAPPYALDAFDEVADRTVCPLTPSSFRAVGQWYEHFDQTTDEEVRHLLSRVWDGEGTEGPRRG